MEEIWKDIEGYEKCYQVSNLGRIKSLERVIKTTGGTRVIKEKLKKSHVMKIGYVGINLSINGKSRIHYMHRVIATAFIENPENKPQVNHIDFNRENNKLENLEWVSRSENNKHAWGKQGRIASQVCTCNGEDKPNSVITNEQAKLVVSMLHGGLSPKDIAGRLSISVQAIHKISQGENWKHLGLDRSKCRNFKKSLSDREVEIIRDLYYQKDGKKRVFPTKRLAAIFGVGSTTIFNVIHGKNYPL